MELGLIRRMGSWRRKADAAAFVAPVDRWRTEVRRYKVSSNIKKGGRYKVKSLACVDSSIRLA